MASHQGPHPTGNCSPSGRGGCWSETGAGLASFLPHGHPTRWGCGSCFLGFAGNRMRVSEKLSDSSEVTQLASGSQIHPIVPWGLEQEIAPS